VLAVKDKCGSWNGEGKLSYVVRSFKRNLEGKD